MANFESEKEILVATIESSVKRLFEKYNVQGLPDDVIKEVAARVCNRNIHKVQQAKEVSSDSSLSTDNSSSGSDIESMDIVDEETQLEGSSGSDSDYQIVKNKRKPRNDAKMPETIQKKPKPEASVSGKEKSVNYYDILQGDINRFTIPRRQKIVPEKSAARPPRPPPIITHGLDYNEFNKEISMLRSIPNYDINIGEGRRCTLKPFTESDRKILMEILKHLEVECHSFTPKDQRKTTLVLKGVQHTFQEAEVEVALQEVLKDYKISSVSRLETPRSKRADRKLNAYIVSFEESYDANKIMEVNRLLHQVVHWEKYRLKGISQCKRCQRFGHVASNCAALYRCVKCDQQHGPKECKRTPRDESSKPYCVNCQTEGHPASFRGCPKYKEVIERKNSRREQQKQRETFVREATRNYIQPGKSFSQVLSGTNNKPTTNITKSNPIRSAPQFSPKISQNVSEHETDNFCTKEAKTLFGCDLFTLMSKINNFLPKYKKLTSLVERQTAYLQFTFSLCQGH